MNLSLSSTDFKNYILDQLNNFFPDANKIGNQEFSKAFEIAIGRTEYCFRHVAMEVYCKNGNTYLNHLYSDQYAVFLWFLSNTVWSELENEILANKLFYLNKALHGFSCMYDTKLPKIFLPFHTVGTVLGKAQYSDFFIAFQGCTVGAQNGKYPQIGKGVSMLPNSSIIGDCHIGNRTVIGINVTVYKQTIDDDITVMLKNGDINYRKTPHTWSQRFFNVDL